ncbi:NAD(P)-dependent oxidoreductase [Microvirga sp. 3-52]|uniref:NAD(P)-dependent oxidoreductase n=1 Tax=Microvirga sp. 3-52 TaxID=2792425 RepID=UPI001AC44AAB|nr:NAD(P)-dependent oxidoreductase [Microvirga sp. 3-52]MBO1907217.1 NAD(P)-dependent oxidoreductase [Microvirga sp. 3-52]MBS7454185.1 NAD(P)-dependent oxidoreductase [Microvirga sp. 3-52]
MNEMIRVAFVGLGAMGLPMASNLLTKGFPVTGFDLNTNALSALEASGGKSAGSAGEAASGADVLILMVVNAAQAESVLFEGGALEKLRENGVVALMATCPPAAVEAIEERVRRAGRRLIDAPVSGGVAGAKAATLTIMAAGSRDTFEAVKPLFDALGDKVFHVGERPGQGAMVKTVNQLLCGVHIAVVAEAFALASKVGVDLDILLQILSGSAASSWMLKDRGQRMLQPAPEVASAVDIFVKDLGIVLDAGRDTKAALPLAAAAHQMFLATSGRGDGHEDDSQVIRSYRALNGIQ